jgi:Phage minor capsid protein 2
VPASPELAARLAQTVVGLYLDAEQTLLTRIAGSLAAGIDAPRWAEQRLLAVQRVRVAAERLLAELRGHAAAAVGEAIVTAYNRGGAAAVADLAALLGGRLEDHAGPLPVAAPDAVRVLAAETVGAVTSTHQRILRWVLDTYREVVARVSGQVLLGTQTRRQAAQAALDRLAGRGVTGFVDRAGRSWDLSSYVEMATRTAAGNAAVAGHVDRLQAAGLDLVVVSDAPQECKLCRPWEGEVLTLSGATVGAIEVASATTGRPVRVRVAGSLAQARAAGFQHPNCRHSVSAYLPGATRLPTGTADPQGDADRQRLRYLERQIRSWKRRQAAALDPAAATLAGARVRAYQAAIRQHVATSTAKRQPQREQLGAR